MRFTNRHLFALAVVGFLLGALIAGLSAQAVAVFIAGSVRGSGKTLNDRSINYTINVPAGTVLTDKQAVWLTVTNPVVPVPVPVNCVGAWIGWTEVAGSRVTNADGSGTFIESRTYTVTTPAANGGAACPVVNGTVETRTVPFAAPPVQTAQIWGVVDPAVLGTCSAAVHDAYVVDGGDGWKYRTWHAQVDPSGCTFAHEHGDGPTRMQNAEIAAAPIRFGYIGHRMVSVAEPAGHEEAHEGFKVFIANPGEVNDEGRTNRVFSRSVFHMGTGGPKRFSMPHHSAEIRLIHPEFGLKAFTQLMMDTGGVGTVCDPRKQAPTKDVVSINNPAQCKINSFYEIWTTQASVMFQGREIYRAMATPAVFDPVTVFNAANPTEVVYATDTRVNAIMNFPNNTRDFFRGCDRESYAQPGYWYNAGGRTTYYTDPHGAEVASTAPGALAQVISLSNAVGPLQAPATSDGLAAYKSRPRRWCAPGLGLKN